MQVTPTGALGQGAPHTGPQRVPAAPSRATHQGSTAPCPLTGTAQGYAVGLHSELILCFQAAWAEDADPSQGLTLPQPSLQV